MVEHDGAWCVVTYLVRCGDAFHGGGIARIQKHALWRVLLHAMVGSSPMARSISLVISLHMTRSTTWLTPIF
jgi:hypothetical protein